MPNFESGVKGFVKTYAVVEVSFPIDEKGREDISCKQCPYLSHTTRMCQLNKKPVAFPERNVGGWCPLQPMED